MEKCSLLTSLTHDLQFEHQLYTCKSVVSRIDLFNTSKILFSPLVCLTIEKTVRGKPGSSLGSVCSGWLTVRQVVNGGGWMGGETVSRDNEVRFFTIKTAHAKFLTIPKQYYTFILRILIDELYSLSPVRR